MGVDNNPLLIVDVVEPSFNQKEVPDATLLQESLPEMRVSDAAASHTVPSRLDLHDLRDDGFQTRRHTAGDGLS